MTKDIFIDKDPLPEIPLISVILPIRNEQSYIIGTLEAINSQTYPPEFIEVIVADGQSNDQTVILVEKFATERSKFSVRLVNNKQRIFSTGFNEALKYAKGQVVVMLGGHSRISPTYLEQCVSYLIDTQADCVGGVINTHGDTPISESIALAMSTSFGVGGVAFRITKKNIVKEADTVAFGTYRKEVFDKIGVLDISLVRNQDDEFNYRLRKMGGKIVLVSSIRVDYSSRGNLIKLWKQYFQYGYWKVRVMQKHPAQMHLRQFVPPAFVAFLLSGGILALLNVTIVKLWLIVLISYIFISLFVSMNISRHDGWCHFARLPLIFATLHISYGLGFLIGLSIFANRWLDRK